MHQFQVTVTSPTMNGSTRTGQGGNASEQLNHKTQVKKLFVYFFQLHPRVSTFLQLYSISLFFVVEKPTPVSNVSRVSTEVTFFLKCFLFLFLFSSFLN